VLSSVHLKYKPIAHRANSGDDVPENSLAAVRAAHKLGIEWIECDVQLTSDDIMIVLHDHTLKRTTNAAGDDAKKSISEMNYSEIIKFDLINKSSQIFHGEKIPTLKQFLSLIKELNMGLLLEIKSVVGLERKTAQKTVEILEQCGFVDYPKLLIQSFFVECIQEVKSQNDKIHRALLLEEWEALTRVKTGNILRYPNVQAYACKEPIEEILLELKCSALSVNHTILNPQRIMQIKEKMAIPLLLAWTVNTSDRVLELYNSGVDSIIGDYPISILQKSKQMEKLQ
jgi:glycerophosphoryl diester phosphodiesterase